MKARLAALSAGLEELGCEALLVLAPSAQDSDLSPFLPGPAHLGESLLVLPRGGEPRLGFLTPMEREEAASTGLALLTPEDLDVSRWSSEFPDPATFLARVVGRALDRCGVATGRVALAGHGQAGVIQGACGLLAALGWTWVPGNALVFSARKRKEPSEVAGIREAAAATAAALRSVARLLAAATVAAGGELWLEGERLRVARLRAEIARVLAGAGCEQPLGNIVAPAEEGAVPHSAGTQERVLRVGESLVVDLYPRAPSGLFADCTRTFCVGEPPEALARGHALVCEALAEAWRRSTPGARGWDVQEAVCEHFAAAGFPTPISEPGTTRGYVHNLGHGVGFDLHELPTFKKASGAEGVLREGDVVTLEPGLYEPAEGWAVRLEDLVRLGPAGLESFTPLPYDLDPRAWGSL
jgi:Xaa-Pro aminopeptidase